jgi:MtfA peptidase
MLSWRDVRRSGQTADQGYNVVIHEFAHVLDMADGAADGVPLLPPDLPRALWIDTLTRTHQTFAAQVDAGEDTALDPYGAQSPEEFFAVATEALFVSPQRLRQAHPEFHDLLARFYRRDAAITG